MKKYYSRAHVYVLVATRGYRWVVGIRMGYIIYGTNGSGEKENETRKD
jgi:hypothetical protein